VKPAAKKTGIPLKEGLFLPEHFHSPECNRGNKTVPVKTAAPVSFAGLLDNEPYLFVF
jgi:hypothetical protein